MINGVRLAERLQAAGLSQSELGRRVGISQQTVHKLITGQSRGSTHIATIAKVLGTSPAYLAGETEDPNEGAVPAPTERDIAEHLDLVAITEIDQDYGMGGTFTGDHVELQVHHFPRLWIESITSSPPTLLTLARGKGDSMDPTIRDRDMVIIDRSRRKLDEADAIWALTVGDIGMIKRLRLRGSIVVIQSDNDRVKDEEVHADEVNLVGRVVFIGRRT
ncbi:XRE family transcriptional regulator [Sphingomonas hylomeconis]|uniref:XRE family transcriptional regulator n=1 Tax=Sphingomonas hylomeconis TaxID=1395958 RepID=A0ABV7SRB9_9SPHN|nr:S24 family peptidase [Sphingomonas hylomeconis]